VIEYALLKLENAYKIPNLRVQGRVCKTNLPSNTAFRGFGFPQGAFVTETWVSAVAAKCHLPPEKVRELNMYKTIDRTIHKQEFDPANLIKCWETCMDNSSYCSRKRAVEEFNQQSFWKKRGIAIIPMKFSVGFPRTFYNQVASRELKIPMSYIHLDEMNTVTVPNTIATGGSTGADVNGRAVQNACQILMKRLEPIISQNPNGTWEEWNIRTDIVMDGCYSINPAVDIGQELKYSPEGVLYTRGPNQYKIPSVTDIPEEFHVSLLTPTQNPKAIYSSKGLGEAGLFLGSSVFFAIADAVAAARKERGLPPMWAMNSPATAELIRMACEDQFTDLPITPEAEAPLGGDAVVRLTGTKYGCGSGGCGACTVMVSRYDPENKKIQYPLHWPGHALGTSGKDKEPCP
ncbi:hypothetical protein A6R68_12954, partial [Neotoma lepida]